MRPVLPTLVALPALFAVANAGPAATVSYSYPPQARAIPALRAWFDQQAAALRSAVQAQAAADRRDAAKEGRTFIAYDSDCERQVVTDTPRFLSLSLVRSDFTGGAHGGSGFAALIWDKRTARRLTPLSFFTGAAALRSAIRPAFCRGLDAERRKKRDGDLGTGGFSGCIDPVAETVILGSSTRTRFDRIGILIAPYDAGPYAEGDYEVTLPVTPAVLAAVRPEWRSYFAPGAGSQGTP